MDESPKPVTAIILGNTRELAYQIKKEFDRFTKYLPGVRAEVIYGGEPIQDQVKLLNSDKCPQIIVGTPGRIKALITSGQLKLDNLKMFILDECDKLLDELGTTNLFTILFITLIIFYYLQT